MAEKASDESYNIFKKTTDGLMARGQSMVDAIFPPQKRQDFLEAVKAFYTSNPKLAAFLLTNVALTGLPLLLFIVFSITVFVFSLIAALLIGLVAALLFTVFCVGVALVIVLPTVFITTMGATFLFLWGLGGYYILQWFTSMNPAKVGDAIGDKLNAFSGGRLDFLMQGIRNPTSAVPVNLPGQGGEKEPLLNGQGKENSKESSKENASGPPKLATKNKAGGVTNPAGGATSAVSGVANGVVG